MAITNNNVQNVKFLRNGNLFATREAARTALNGFELTYEKDGTAILARYGSDNAVKTLVGWVYANNSGNKSITIFDIDDAGTDAKEYVDSLVGSGITSANTATAQLEALSGNSSTDTSATTSVAGAKKYTDAKIAETIDGLDVTAISAPAGAFIKSVSQSDGKVSATTEYMPTVSAISAEGQAITAVSQSNGTVSAATGDIAAAHVTVADSGSLIAATDVEGALAEIAAEIDAMDLTQVGDGNGKVIIAVSEQDGKVSASATSVSDLTLEGFEANTATTGAVTSADTIEGAINKLENKAAAITIANSDGSINVTTAATGTDINVNIKSGEKVIAKSGNAGIYTDLDLIKITTGLPAEIKERYQLLATDDSQIGANIDIPKDSHIVSINYITSGEHAQNLEYVYIDVSGNTQTTYVDMSELVLEAEFASGTTVTDHVVRGVVDPTSENFLTVGANGFKLDGVQTAIDTAISGLDASVSAETTSKHVSVKIDEVDGKLTAVTLTDNDIASQAKLDELSGKSVTAVEMTGGTVTTASTTDGTKKITINADGSSIKMTGYAKGSASGAVESTDSVNAAIGKLENQIAGQIDALDADISGNSTHVTVGVEEVNGKITAVTVSESNIANANDLTNEIAARKAVDGQSGQTYAANSGKAYISGATSLNDADIKLNDALASLDADVIKSVKVNNVALAESSNAVNVQISSVAASGAASSPIVVNTDNSTGAVTLQIQYLDCGTY